MVRLPIKCPMPQHLPSRVVMIHQLMQTVVIDVQIQPQHTTYQDLPQRHPGPAMVHAHLRGNLLFQQLEHLGTQR